MQSTIPTKTECMIPGASIDASAPTPDVMTTPCHDDRWIKVHFPLASAARSEVLGQEDVEHLDLEDPEAFGAPLLLQVTGLMECSAVVVVCANAERTGPGLLYVVHQPFSAPLSAEQLPSSLCGDRRGAALAQARVFPGSGTRHNDMAAALVVQMRNDGVPAASARLYPGHCAVVRVYATSETGLPAVLLSTPCTFEEPLQGWQEQIDEATARAAAAPDETISAQMGV